MGDRRRYSGVICHAERSEASLIDLIFGIWDLELMPFALLLKPSTFCHLSFEFYRLPLTKSV